MNSSIWFCITALCAVVMVSCDTTKNNSCLAPIGAEKVALPYVSGTVNYDLQSPDNELRDCLLRMFSGQTLNTPLAFDDSYRLCLNYHREDNDLVYSTLPHTTTFVLHLDSTDRYDVYLLHEKTDSAIQSKYYDILFTTDKHGKLINQVLAGASGIMYKRDFSVLPLQKFTITEMTVREGINGPRYQATFRINQTGKFMLVQSTTEQTSGTDSLESDNGEEKTSESGNIQSYNDVIGIEKNKNIRAALEGILFAGNQREKYFEPQTFFGKKCWLAVSTIGSQESGVSDFSFIVVYPLPEGTSTDKSLRMYKTVGYVLPGGKSSDLLGGEIKSVRYERKGAYYLLTLTISRSSLVSEGASQTKILTQQKDETTYIFSYNNAGELKLQ